MTAAPILITGATGTLGRGFARACAARGLPCRVTTRAELDIADRDQVAEVLDAVGPWLVINAAGYVRVDHAELDLERCHRENALGPATLAAACRRAGIGLVTFSSDLVFDGAKRAVYTEDDRPAPLSVYGRSKAEAEARVLDEHAGAMVVRTSAFFGPNDAYNFLTATLRDLAAGRTVRVADDATVSPTYIPDLIDVVLDLAIDGETGLWHLANAGALTWCELARAAAERAGVDAARLLAVPSAHMGWRAPRPLYSALASRRAALMPSFDDSLGRYLHARQHGLTA